MKLIALVGTLVLTLSLASPAQAKEKDDTVAATREPAGQIQHSRELSEQLERARVETDRAHAELAEHIATDRQRFEETIRGGDNTPVAVADPVPVYWNYISAWSTGAGVTQFRDDIYARDGVDELQLTSAL